MKKVIFAISIAFSISFISCSSSEDVAQDLKEDIENSANEIGDEVKETVDCVKAVSTLADFTGSTPLTVTGDDCEAYKAAIQAVLDGECVKDTVELEKALEQLGDCM